MNTMKMKETSAMKQWLAKIVLCVLALAALPAMAHAQIPNTCDFDGDGKTDPVIIRAVGGQYHWWISRSSDGGSQFVSWGVSDDYVRCGDYDNDGKSDVTIWRGGVTRP